MTAPGAAREVAVGDEIELDIGNVAHGGSCVARVDGRVVFVRYALPGERAVVRITEARAGSFCRGEAIRVVRAHPQRVVAPCAHFGPGGCGGCDFQHADADLQRELKATVVREQLARLAGLDVDVTVEPLPGGGFGWRSRVRWAIGRPGARGGDRDGTARDGHRDIGDGYDGDGRDGDGHDGDGCGGGGHVGDIGPRRFRSHLPVPISAQRPCLIAAPALSEAVGRLVPPARAEEVVLVRRPDAEPAVTFLVRGRPVGPGRREPGGRGEVLTEHAYDRAFAVSAPGFWQAHDAAATVLSGAVDDALTAVDLVGGSAWDLYGGVGVFAAVLADLTGPRGSVVTVESDRAASGLAARNLADLPQARAVAARVDRFLRGAPGRVDAVLLDPPRSGAGAAVCVAIASRHPAMIVYVACDPAALGRDAAALIGAGYRLTALRAFDAFPQTHHVECVASFTPVT